MKWLGCALVDFFPAVDRTILAKSILSCSVPDEFRIIFFESFDGVAVSDLLYTQDNGGEINSVFGVVSLPDIAIGAIYAPSYDYRCEFKEKYSFGTKIKTVYLVNHVERP